MDEFVKTGPVGHDPEMLENVYKGVLHPLPDAWCALRVKPLFTISWARPASPSCLLMLQIFALRKSIGW